MHTQSPRIRANSPEPPSAFRLYIWCSMVHFKSNFTHFRESVNPLFNFFSDLVLIGLANGFRA